MNYDQLAAFLAVAEAGTFGAASERLHKSQPAVSKLVSNLEADLGVLLFDRSAYRPVLTDAGRLFRERAALVVEQTHALRAFARQLAGDAEPVVRLVVEMVTPLGPVMAALAAVRRRFPRVQVELRSEALGSVLEALDRDRADLSIAQLREIDPPKMQVEPYDEVPILPLARADHPLARRPGPLDAAALLDHVQVVLRESAPGAASYSLNLIEGAHQWFVSDITSKLEVILAGMGWGGLPEPVARPALARGELVELDVPDFRVRRMKLCLVRSSARAPGVAADALWRELLARRPGGMPPARAPG
jgi:DNA-binding transcriptional LysR family regulator